jgi:anti-sigma factor RsiW
MECHSGAQVEAYHDGELSPPRRAEFEAHMRDCDACRTALAQSRALSALVAGAPLTPMPDEALERLRGSFDVIRARALGERMAQERQTRERGVLRIAGWLTAAAAALLMGGLLMLSPSRPPPVVDFAQTSNSWDAAPVMPPNEEHEGMPETIQVAQWIADDLSNSIDLPRGNR